MLYHPGRGILIYIFDIMSARFLWIPNDLREEQEGMSPKRWHAGAVQDRDARRQDLLRAARRRRAPAHARATSAMPAVKSRRFLCATQAHAKTLRFPMVFY